jgi:hypothetical protein
VIERLTIERAQDWQSRMNASLRSAAQRTMEWGVFDCALLSALHIDALCGTQLYDAHSGHYSDRDGANAYLAFIGCTDLPDLATQLLGAPIDYIRKGQRGDIACFPTDQGAALGIVDLSGLKIAGINPSAPGLVRIPLSMASAVWRV